MTFTAKNICLRGHNISEVGRYKNRECRECRRIRVAEWKLSNRDQVLAYARAYAKAYRAVGRRNDDNEEIWSAILEGG